MWSVQTDMWGVCESRDSFVVEREGERGRDGGREKRERERGGERERERGGGEGVRQRERGSEREGGGGGSEREGGGRE